MFKNDIKPYTEISRLIVAALISISITYAILLLIETVYEGFVSTYFDTNFLVFLGLGLGVVYLFLPKKNGS